MTRYLDLWRAVQAPALLMLMVGFTFPIRKKIGYACTVALWIQFAMGLNVLYFGYPAEPKFNFHLSTVAGEATLWLFVCALLCIEIKPKHWNSLKILISVFGLFDAILMLVTDPMMGLMPGASTNSAFLACVLPLAMSIWAYRGSLIPRAIVGIYVVAIFKSGGTTGIAAAGLALLVYYGTSLIKFWRWAPALVLLVLLVPSNDRATFFTSRGRTNEWAAILNHWLQSDWISAMFGTGPGTFEWLNPIRTIRAEGTPPRQLFLWAHNEPLQILTENGLLGLCAALNLIVRLLTSRLSREALASTAALLICCATQYPLRMFPFQLLIIAIMGVSLKDEPWQNRV